MANAAMSRWLAAACGGVGSAALFGGLVGVAIGAAVTVLLAQLLSRLEPRVVRVQRQQLRADLPVALDLLAACLVAGQPLAPALGAVSDAIGGAVGTRLRPVAAALSLGADAASAWASVIDVPELQTLARGAARASQSGRALADHLGRLAETYRCRRQAAVEAKVRQVAVLAVGPLGLCFLPAFVAVGVVPVVVGLVHNSLG